MFRTNMHAIGARARRRAPIVAALLVAARALSSCGRTTSAPNKTITQRQSMQQLTIALETPERPALLTEQELLVTLTDPNGKPVDGAEVWLGLIMPTMQMSPNEPDATPGGNGQYRVKAIFTMAGTWSLEVHATVQGQEYVATFRAQTA